MAHLVMAYLVVMACIVMAFVVMACIVVAYIVMACIFMAVLLRVSCWLLGGEKSGIGLKLGSGELGAPGGLGQGFELVLEFEVCVGFRASCLPVRLLWPPPPPSPL